MIAAASIAAFCLFSAVAVVGLAGKARDALSPAVGTGHAAVVRYAILLIGGSATLVVALSLMKVPVGQLLVGGAVTTILLGIAGQQSLSNIFAGLVLLLSRPFTVGDYIRLKSGALGGVTEGLVTGIGITYLRIDTEDGVLNLPNSQVLAAAVGPMTRPGPGGGQPAPAAPPGTAPPDATGAQQAAGSRPWPPRPPRPGRSRPGPPPRSNPLPGRHQPARQRRAGRPRAGRTRAGSPRTGRATTISRLSGRSKAHRDPGG